MELWIRSQDKMNLCKAHDLIIRENHSGYGDVDYVIQDLYTMGTYKTKERALEVLDEIHRILDPTGLKGSVISISNFNTYVYEMPKE